MTPLYIQRQRSARNSCSLQHRPALKAVSSVRAAVRPAEVSAFRGVPQTPYPTSGRASSRESPAAVAHQVKRRIRDAVGSQITCSIGCAPNRWLAKIASAMDKADGLTVLRPEDLPGSLLELELTDLPGVGGRMRTRRSRCGIVSVSDLWRSDPTRLRAVWGNVTGARIWYALHGYGVEAPSTRRRSIGRGRVLPPGHRRLNEARPLVRQLMVKAARRLRRSGFVASRLTLWVACLDAPAWSASTSLPAVSDDLACLDALSVLWSGSGSRSRPGGPDPGRGLLRPRCAGWNHATQLPVRRSCTSPRGRTRLERGC